MKTQSILLIKGPCVECKNNDGGESWISHSRTVPSLCSQDEHNCVDNMRDIKLDFYP